MKNASLISGCFALFFVSVVLAEDEPRDPYAEPAHNAHKTTLGQDSTENIDPFSGHIQLSYVDMSVPGNGGLDINVYRYYNLPQGAPSYSNPMGHGWTMHYGRLTIGSSSSDQLCGTGSVATGTILDNPSIEMPTGGRELLVNSKALGDGTFVTKSNWKAECINPDNYLLGMKATAPNGTEYFMREHAFMQGEEGAGGKPPPYVETWYVDEIVDVHGNSLSISYETLATGAKLLTQISASDGRVVNFSYLDHTGSPITSINAASKTNARLNEIESNGQVWRYHYVPITQVAEQWGPYQHFTLQSVERPDGTTWEYRYGTNVTEELDYNRLVEVTYPAGGKVNYSYQVIYPYSPDITFRIFAIDTKTQTNPGQPTGSWEYSFTPGGRTFGELGLDFNGSPLGDAVRIDETIIDTPLGEERVYHFGYWGATQLVDGRWLIGFKFLHEIYEQVSGGGLDLIQRQNISATNRVLSDEVNQGGRISAVWDPVYRVPEIASMTTKTNGYTTRVDYISYDDFGSATQVKEYFTGWGSQEDLIRDTTYVNDTTSWFIGLPDTVTLRSGSTELGAIVNTYLDTGMLESETKFGVSTHYTYTSEGDKEEVTDARGNVTKYSNYFRGIPQLEEYPDGTQRSRTVNNAGTVASETSGRGFTTSYTYDDFNRLTGIDFPLGEEVVIHWLPNSKEIIRGDFREKTTWDGFNRNIHLKREDTGAGIEYERTTQYDELNRKVFQSDLESTLGISWEYDILGRIRKTTNQDGTVRSVNYISPVQEEHFDENGNRTEFRYNVYGNESNRHLHVVLSEEDLVTVIDRDPLGNITEVFQGGPNPENPGSFLGSTRTYHYNANYYLTSMENPQDIGLITYGRDILGNMTSKQVSASNVVNYSYDSMNRLEAVDYVNDLIDVSYTYNDDGLVHSVSNGYSNRIYSYNQNGTRISEEITIDDAIYSIGYGIDSLDNIASVTYPSGRVVSYEPDALGRPTKALPYINSVSYFPSGSLESIHYANGVTNTYTRTARHWIDSILVSKAAILESQDYTYDNSGNVLAIDDLVAVSKSRTMAYDGLNRLVSASGGWGSSAYEYDYKNNIVRKTDPLNPSRDLIYHYSGMRLDSITYSDSSDARSFEYDEYGNVRYSDDVKEDLSNRVSRENSFNDAGNLTFSRRTTTDGVGELVPTKSGAFTAFYDAKGNRVRKINHSRSNSESEYVYSDSGLLFGEYDESGVLFGHEYFYLGTMQIASAKTNSPPTIETVASVESSPGLTVQLSASDADIDGEIVSREWTEVSSYGVDISDPSQSIISFTAPATSGVANVVLSYQVTDSSGETTEQIVTVTVTATPPIADAGANTEGLAGQEISLDGSNSSTEDGGLTYSWTGPGLVGSTSATPTVVIPDDGVTTTVTYTLTVTNHGGLTSTDTVDVTAYSTGSDGDSDGLPDAWEWQYSGSAYDIDPEGDPDGDGQINLAEYSNGLSPTEPNVALLLAVKPNATSNGLVWTQPHEAASYTLIFSANPNLPLAEWNELYSGDMSHYLHEGLNGGQKYYYVVQAVEGGSTIDASSVVEGVPAVREWSEREEFPIALTTLESWQRVRSKANKYGDMVFASAAGMGSTSATLSVWRYSIFSGWSAPETKHVSNDFGRPELEDFEVAIDAKGNIAIAAINSGKAELYSWPFQGRLNSGHALDGYWQNFDNSDDQEIMSVEIAGDGQVLVCWVRQLWQAGRHPFAAWAPLNGLTETGSIDLMAGNPEVSNFFMQFVWGKMRSMSCSVSPEGNAVAAWAGETLHPDGSGTDDLWVSIFDAETDTWGVGETVEFIATGVRDSSGSDESNGLPATSISDSGEAVVAWHNDTVDELQTAVYDLDQEVWRFNATGLSSYESSPYSIHYTDRIRGRQFLETTASGKTVLNWGRVIRIRGHGDADWKVPRTDELNYSASTSYYGNTGFVDENGGFYGTYDNSTSLVFGSIRYNGNWRHQNTDLAYARPPHSQGGLQRPYILTQNFNSLPSLYWLDVDAGINYQVTPKATTEPVVVFTNNKYEGGVGTQIEIDASGSYYLLGEVLDYEWNAYAYSGSEEHVQFLEDDNGKLYVTSEREEVTFFLGLTITTSDGKQAVHWGTEVVFNLPTENQAPVADAGSDISVALANAVELDGSQSYDIHSDITFSWTGDGLSDSSISNPSVLFVDEGINFAKTYTLVVEDTEGLQDTDTVTILFYSMTADSDADSLSDGWEAQYFGSIEAYGGTDDPDGDGYTNAEEFSLGINPVVANAPPGDFDADGVVNALDNCLNDSNLNQTDSDGDGVGNVCDLEQITLISIAAEDGWVREKNENADIGKTVNSNNTGNKALRVGDDNKDRQFKSIVSFDLSILPANSSIFEATLELTRVNGSVVGDTSSFGSAQMALSMGGFGGNSALEKTDFETAASVENVGALTDGTTAVGDIDAAGLSVIQSEYALGVHKLQLRLGYNADDDDDEVNDYIGYFASDTSNADRHPRLILGYTLAD